MKEVIDTVSVALASGEVEELGGAVMQEVNRSLLSAGVNEEWADKIESDSAAVYYRNRFTG